jgi:hypothetical protein
VIITGIFCRREAGSGSTVAGRCGSGVNGRAGGLGMGVG